MTWLRSRVRFCFRAIRSEFKRSRRFSILATISLALNLVTFIGLFTPLRLPVPNWSWRVWLILFESGLITFLFFVFEAAYRFHLRASREAIEKYDLQRADFEAQISKDKTREQLAVVLNRLMAQGQSLYLTLDGCDLHPMRLQAWHSEIMMSVAVVLGNDTAIEFQKGLPTELNSLDEKRKWLNERVKKLLEIDTHQYQKHLEGIKTLLSLEQERNESIEQSGYRKNS